MDNWEVLFDGEVTTAADASFQFPVAKLGKGEMVKPSSGDTVRLTIDGKTAVYTVELIMCGNKYLFGDYADDGFDLCLYTPAVNTVFITRTAGTHTIKVERLTESTLDKASFLQGWLVGRRLAGMRK